MKKIFYILAVFALVAFSNIAYAASSETAQIVTAANEFIATLTEKQQSSVQFAFDDSAQRKRWSNLPTKFSQRAGLTLGELNEAQRTAALKLLSSTLSKKGYEKIQQIVEGDEVLKTSERNNPMFGKDLFYISLLGKPSEKDPWMLQFGGHHLGLNITIVGESDTLTPTLTAVQPAVFTRGGKTIRPLGRENDKAFALVNSLDEAQRKQTILGFQMRDLVLGPGQDGRTIAPEGIKAEAAVSAPAATEVKPDANA